MTYVGGQTGHISSSSLVFPPGQEIEIDGYSLLNLVLKYHITEKLSLKVTAHNIMDTEYSYAEHIRKKIAELPGGPGRSYYFKLIYNFGVFKGKLKDYVEKKN